MKYYSADFHFGNYEMMQKWNRPGTTCEEYNQMLLKNINDTVSPMDKLIILGDVGSYKNSTSNLVNKIECEKILVKGNHDFPLLKHKNFRDMFEKITDVLLVQDGDYRIICSHYPQAEWEGFYRGTYHFYGHAHMGNPVMQQLEKAVCVSVDCNQFTPKTAEQLIKEKNEEFKKIKQINFFSLYENGHFGYNARGKNNDISSVMDI